MKQNKINIPLFIFSCVLILTQLCVLAINFFFSDFPWQSQTFTDESVLNKIITLCMYFLVGAVGIILFPISLIYKNTIAAPSDKKYNIRKLAMCAMLLALYIVIQSLAIDVFNFLRITFNFLVTGTVGMFFGPITGAVFGIAADIMGFLVHPGTGGFFPAYTVIGALKGFLYGAMLYKGRLCYTESPPSLLRTLATKSLDTVICNMLCMTFVNAFLYDMDFFVIFPLRAFKNFVMLPVETILLHLLLMAFWKINKKAKLKF